MKYMSAFQYTNIQLTYCNQLCLSLWNFWKIIRAYYFTTALHAVLLSAAKDHQESIIRDGVTSMSRRQACILSPTPAMKTKPEVFARHLISSACMFDHVPAISAHALVYRSYHARDSPAVVLGLTIDIIRIWRSSRMYTFNGDRRALQRHVRGA